MAMTLWAISFFRNKKVWENKVVTPRFVVEWSMNQLHDWKSAVSKVQGNQKPSVVTVRRENSRWVRPDQGKIKVNVDAAIVQGSSYFSAGMLLRDSTWVFLEGKTMKFNRVLSVMEAESTAIEEALKWIASKGIKDVCVESDSLLAVQAINGTTSF
ncbi:uncharacterized protein LOC141692079 [Apium graveolens]|uniref:uncharacterized protein LOC141692079 n=1 Tax=Apium graveolens TaxID=4045 RepID=UPI003D7A22F9